MRHCYKSLRSQDLVVLTTTLNILTSCLRAFHWLVHTAFYAIVLQLSSVREFEPVRCCLRCRTVESRKHCNLYLGVIITDYHWCHRSGNWAMTISWDLDFENSSLRVCRCHKSRSKWFEVTVCATASLDLQSCQIWNVYLTSRPCTASRNIQRTFATSPKLGGAFAHLYLENAKSYEKVTGNRKHPWPLAIRCIAQICSRPKG